MPPLRGSELRGVCDKPAAHAAGYVMSPLQGSADAPALPMTPAAGHNAHDPSYFAHVRPEILALIPETARAVLDIGCGAGRLGEAIKARQQAEVVGIELNEAAAAAAQTRVDRVLVGDVETLTVSARSWEGEAPAEPRWPLPARTEPTSRTAPIRTADFDSGRRWTTGGTGSVPQIPVTPAVPMLRPRIGERDVTALSMIIKEADSGCSQGARNRQSTPRPSAEP
jgi:SAM-dependent methyltransferase